MWRWNQITFTHFELVFSYFPLGFEGRIWDLIVSAPGHCLSFYFPVFTNRITIYTDRQKLPVREFNGNFYMCSVTP